MKKILFVFLCFLTIGASAQWDYVYEGYGSTVFGYDHVERYDVINDSAEAFLDADVIGEINYSASSLTYGVRAEIANYYLLKEAYTYIQHEYLRVELGWVLNIAQKFAFDVPEASYTRFNNYSIFYEMIGNGIVSHLTSSQLDTDYNNAKISLITGKWNGFQLGASYTPGSVGGYDKDSEYDSLNNDKKFEQSIAVGAKFYQDWGYYKLGLSAGYLQMDKANNIHVDLNGARDSFEKRQEYSASANFEMGNWEIGANYRLINNVLPYGTNNYEGWVVSSGIQYSFLEYAVSLNYQRSEMAGVNDILGNNDIVDLYQVSFKYNPQEHINFWLSVGVVDLKDEIFSNQNWGGIAMFGVSLDF